MRVLVLIKANHDSESGKLPSEKMLTEMGKFNEELIQAGVMLSGEGLHPSAKGKRVRFAGGKTSVIDGPFAETKELIAGFWIWRVSSVEEAVEWVKRIPGDDGGDEGMIEIRPIFEMEEFAATLTPELRDRKLEMRAKIEAK